MDKKEYAKSVLQEEGCTFIKFEGHNIHYQDENGYKYKKNVYNQQLANGIRKHQFDIKNPYCIDNINLVLSKGNKYGTRIIPETYKGSKEKCSFACGKCGKQFEDLLWNVINYEHKVCPNCIHSTQKSKLTEYSALKEEIESYGYIWLDDNWKGNHAFINVMDKDGYKAKMKLEYLRYGVELTRFSGGNPFLIENLRLYCEHNDLDFESIYEKFSEGKYSKSYHRKNDTPEGFVVRILFNKKFFHTPMPKGRSSLQSKVKKFLEDNNIDFIEEYQFPDCIYRTPLSFDFYLPKLNITIEVQGRQHYVAIEYFGGEPVFKEQLERDEVKREYCKNNSITLIEVPYYEFDRKETYKTTLKRLIT